MYTLVFRPEGQGRGKGSKYRAEERLVKGEGKREKIEGEEKGKLKDFGV